MCNSSGVCIIIIIIIIIVVVVVVVIIIIIISCEIKRGMWRQHRQLRTNKAKTKHTRTRTPGDYTFQFSFVRKPSQKLAHYNG
jgi:uncharacterized membrane protein